MLTPTSTQISNLAMADLRRLPPGTLPPIVQKFDASSLPVCLITLKGEGLSETELRDLGQFAIRNQLAGVSGASVPPPFGGKYRQIMVYVDPAKLQAYQMSPMDVVRAVNNANLILPSGDVKIGPFDYTIFTNSQFRDIRDINRIPLKTVNGAMVTVSDIGRAEDANQIQNNIVEVDGQRSAYLPVMKQGGDTNTIAVVNGVKDVVSKLVDVPAQLTARCGLRSVAVRQARDRDLAGRRKHRAGVDRPDGPGVSRQHAGDAVRLSLDPAVCPGSDHCPVLRGQLDQHDDSGRLRAGVLASDRQRRHRAREHLQASRDGRAARRRRRTAAATKSRWPCWPRRSPVPWCSSQSRFSTE